jgi:ACS family glucarate transporter-like MFS transporter
LWCLLSALTVFVSPAFGEVLPQLIILRFALGLGEAVMYPSANQFTAFWIPVQERAMANGWIFAGVGAGAGIAPPVVTALMLSYGWRASFWFSAAVGLVGALGWYLLARDRPEQHSRVSQEELAHIKAGFSKAPNRQGATLPWGRIFASKCVWALTLSYFCFGYITFIFLNWFFIYLADVRGLNLAKSALYAMMPFIAMTVCCLAGGGINDWLSRYKSRYIGRCVFAAAALVLTSIFLVLGSQAADAFWASVTLAGGAGALYLSQSSYWAVTADFAGPHAGLVSGLMNMGCQIAGAITASLTPWIALHFSWNAAFYVAAASGIIGAIAWLFVDPSQSLMEG